MIETTEQHFIMLPAVQVTIYEHQQTIYNIPFKQTTRNAKITGIITYSKSQCESTIEMMRVLSVDKDLPLRTLILELTTMKGKHIQVQLNEVRILDKVVNVGYQKNPDHLQVEYQAKYVEVNNLD